MNQIKKDLLKDLMTLKNMLIDCDNFEISQQIKYDIKKIEFSIEEKGDYEFLNFQNVDKNILSKIVSSNQLPLESLMPQVINSYTSAGEIIFYNFLKDTKLNLNETYENILINGGIYLLEKGQGYVGSTKYIQTLGKNYIEICNTGTTFDFLILSHELGHAKQNNKFKKESYNSKSSNFSETYPIFLELKFIDHLESCGVDLESLNLEIYKLKYILTSINYFYHDLNCNSCVEKYRLKLLLSNLLALNLYYISKENKSLDIIELFLDNYGKMDDETLLNSINMSYDTLSNSDSIVKYYNKIKKYKKG